VAVDLTTRKVVFGPEITARGFTDDPGALDPIRKELITTVEQSLAEGVRDADALAHIVRRTVGRWVDQTYRRRPMLMPMVVEV
jgi:ribonuclease J